MKLLMCLILLNYTVYGQKINELSDAQMQLLNTTVENLNDKDLAIFLSHYKEDLRIGKLLKNMPIDLPLEKARLQSSFGMRFHPIEKRYAMHEGLDLKADRGTKIYAAGAGTISRVGYSSSNGNFVCIKHSFGFESMYCHLESISVDTGTEISIGEVIGTVGSTGKSTGPHLHFAIKRNNRYINPLLFLGSI
jgi:murein DD-endopeptidase MepM/ murein hydrolase activator NlpD